MARNVNITEVATMDRTKNTIAVTNIESTRYEKIGSVERIGSRATVACEQLAACSGQALCGSQVKQRAAISTASQGA
jgi:hypothetical protein